MLYIYDLIARLQNFRLFLLKPMILNDVYENDWIRDNIWHAPIFKIFLCFML